MEAAVIKALIGSVIGWQKRLSHRPSLLFLLLQHSGGVRSQSRFWLLPLIGNAHDAYAHLHVFWGFGAEKSSLSLGSVTLLPYLPWVLWRRLMINELIHHYPTGDWSSPAILSSASMKWRDITGPWDRFTRQMCTWLLCEDFLNPRRQACGPLDMI